MKSAIAQSEPITVPAGEFKAKCLKLMDEANEKQQAITVTKRGKVVGQFVPKGAEAKTFRSIFGRSPALVMPNDAEWKKFKSEQADEWEESINRTARQVNGDFDTK